MPIFLFILFPPVEFPAKNIYIMMYVFMQIK